MTHDMQRYHASAADIYEVSDGTFVMFADAQAAIAAAKAEEREYVLTTLLRMPVGAVMEIACPTCGWDYGYDSDLMNLFGEYSEHNDNCPE